MPKSRGRKKRKKTQRQSADNKNKIVFRSMNFGGENHAEFKEAVVKSARADVEKFPDLIKELHGVLKERMPEGILSTFAFYGARAAIKSNGETRSLTRDIQQHHIELLQGVILSLPLAEWGKAPVTADVMEVVFNAVPQIADSFIKRRLIEHADETDPEKRAILSLQEKVRLHTQSVRNWGYFSEVKKICREVYAPLDGKMEAAIGYTFSDVLDISEAIIKEIEERSSRHIEIMEKFIRAKDIKTVVEKYWSEMPGIAGSPEDFLKVIPPGTSREGVIGVLMSHADLRHAENMSLTATEVADLTDKSVKTVDEILKTLSISPGELKGQEIEYLFLANPVWARPGINYGNGYIFAIPQAIFSHINEIMWNIAVKANLGAELAARRAVFLEDKIETILGLVLPTARIQKNAKWKVGGQQFETDIIAFVDKTVILAEAKSHRLTPQGLRGAPDSLKRHLNDMVIAPSVQSERLAKHIILARTGDAESLAITQSLGLEASKIDQIVRISITLDDLSVLCSSEEELKEISLIPEGHNLAPALNIADLCCIANILNEELLFIHYFSERFHFQKLFNIFGDELDFLGMYLSTGFNLGTGNKDFRNLIVTGLSDVIDRYYDGTEAGLALNKPRARVHRIYKEIINHLSERKPEGWTTIGIHLLNSASPDEQVKVERGLTKLRKSVTRKAPLPRQQSFMQIIPPLNRKASVGFFVYCSHNLHLRREYMEHLAAEALEREETTTCVIFAKNADNWSAPYEAVLLVQKQGEVQPELKS